MATESATFAISVKRTVTLRGPDGERRVYGKGFGERRTSPARLDGPALGGEVRPDTLAREARTP
ncbi:hypothetical protein ABZ589_29540 [Streptomyces sp. NPDC013313]|uniref:hypothetical protein n=1 Tax=Streptomyces sp. NPDC013313 TaxID=3155603 RepID=UPI0033D9F7A7